MSPRTSMACLTFGLLLGAFEPPAHAADVVYVNCNKNQTIAKALSQNAPQLIIEIRGLCHERVLIRRSGVTLRGADPAVDGIVGPVGPNLGLVEVGGADIFHGCCAAEDTEWAVLLENLSLKANDGWGLITSNSNVQLKNCWLADNGFNGAHVSGAGAAHFIDTHFERNGATGLSVNRASQVICERCTFDDNGAFAVSVNNSAIAFLADSSITGTDGVNANQEGRVNGTNTLINASDRAFNAIRGTIEWSGSSFGGRIQAARKSSMWLTDTAQTSSPGDNDIRGQVTLQLRGSTLLGTTRLALFSNGQVFPGLGPAALGDLACETGSDLFCDSSTSKASSSCGLCP